MMRAIIVAAVSTANQAGDDKGSLDDQIARCTEVCKTRGWDVTDIVSIRGHSRNYEWLDEIAKDSAEYAYLLDRIRDEDEGVDIIVVRDYDRLWRTDALRAQVTALCRQHRVQIYSLNQPADVVDPRHLADTSDSRLILEALSGVLSEQENRNRVRRMKQGKIARVERRGLHCTTLTPFGYRWTGTDTPPRTDPAEAATVRWMFERRALDRWSFYRIAEALTEQGVRLPSERNRTGSWHANSVRGMLRNPFYLGHIRYGNVYTENGRQEPIISQELWDKCRVVDRLQTTKRGPVQRGHRLLSGLARCADCDHAMVYVPTTTREPGLALRCSYYVHTRGRGCHGNWMRAEPVEELVLREAQRVLRNPDEWRKARGKRNSTGDELAEVESTLADLTARWERWSRAYEVGSISLDEMLRHREQLLGQRDRWAERQRELQDLHRTTESMESQWTDLAAYVDTLPALPVPAQRRVLYGLLAEVRLSRKAEPMLLWLYP